MPRFYSYDSPTIFIGDERFVVEQGGQTYTGIIDDIKTYTVIDYSTTVETNVMITQAVDSHVASYYHPNQSLNTTDSAIFSKITTVNTDSELLVPYTFSEEPSTFDMTGATNLGYYDDNDEWQHGLPFPFPFFKESWSLVTLSSNGFLYLGYETSNSPPSSIDANKSGPFICPHGTDLYTEPDSSRLNIISGGTGYTDGIYFVDGTNARSGSRIIGNAIEIRVELGVVTYARWYFSSTPTLVDGFDWISGDGFIINDADIGNGTGASFTVRCIPTIGIWEKIESDGVTYYWVVNEDDAVDLYTEYVSFAIKLYKNGNIRLSYGDRTSPTYNNVVVGINDDAGNYLAGSLDALILQPPGYDNDQIFTYLTPVISGNFDKNVYINGSLVVDSDLYINNTKVEPLRRKRRYSIPYEDIINTIMYTEGYYTDLEYVDVWVNGIKLHEDDYGIPSGMSSPLRKIEIYIQLFYYDSVEIITWQHM